MQRIKQRQRIVRLISISAVAAISYTPFTCAGAKTVRLSDGKTVEILGLSDGTSHFYDTRTFAEETYLRLPKSLRDFLPPMKIQGNAMQLATENDSLGVGIALPAGSGTGQGYNVIMSDGSGWYNSADSIGMANDLRVMSFSMAPRSVQQIKLSFYDDSSPAIPKYLGDITLPNPRYNPFLPRSSSGPPKHVASGTTQIEIVDLFTGLFLPEDRLSAEMKHSATRELTTPVLELLNGHAAAAMFPKGGRSALVFKLNKETFPISTLRNASLTIQDSKGSIYKPWTKIYLSDEQQVLAWWRNMPVTDGDYDFTVNLHQDPPLESSAWKEVEISALPDAEAAESTLDIATMRITAAVDKDHQNLLIKSTGYPNMLAMQLVDKATSRTLLPPTSLADFHRGYDQTTKQWEFTVKLPNGATTGPLTLKLADTIEHQLKFSGLPKRPK